MYELFPPLSLHPRFAARTHALRITSHARAYRASTEQHARTRIVAFLFFCVAIMPSAA